MVTFLYILHCMDFSVNSRWWGEGEMMRPSVQGVDPPVCCTPGCYCYICKRQLCGFPQCAASWMTYARDSFVDSPSGAFCPLEGGGPDTLAPVLQINKKGYFKQKCQASEKYFHFYALDTWLGLLLHELLHQCGVAWRRSDCGTAQVW